MRNRIILGLLITLLTWSTQAGVLVYNFRVYDSSDDPSAIIPKYYVVDTFVELPVGLNGDYAYAKDTNKFYFYNGVSWVSSDAAAGSDTQIQFNDAGIFGGDPDFLWDKTNNLLAIGGTFGSTAGIYSRKAVDAAYTVTVDNPSAGTAGHSAFQLLSDTGAAVNNFAMRSHADSRVAPQCGGPLGGMNDLVSITGVGLNICAFTTQPIYLSNGNLHRIEITGSGVFRPVDWGAKPTCDSTIAGGVFFDAGTPDTWEACTKDAASVYAWRSTIVPIPTGTGYRHITAGVEDAAADLVTLTAASDVAANQGTTTTLLHGNAAGQASFGSVVTGDITNGTILYADIQDLIPLSVLGRSVNSTGVAGEIQAGGDGNILRRAAGVLNFGTIDLAAANAVGTTVLPIANGGTNSTATATNGGVGYGTGSAHAYSVAGTLGQYLRSAGAAVPVWEDAVRLVRLTADYTNATTSMTNTALTWTSPASVSRSGFDCTLMVKSSATTLGAQFDVNSSVAPTTITYRLRWDSALGTAPGTAGTQAFVSTATNATALGPAAGLTTYGIWNLSGVIVHTSSASTVTIRAKASSAGTVTVGSGSHCRYYVL